MRGISLHVFEIQEILASLRHRPELGQQLHHLVVLVLKIIKSV